MSGMPYWRVWWLVLGDPFCLLISTNDQPCLALLQVPMLVRLVYKYPHRAEYLLTFGIPPVHLFMRLHMFVGCEVGSLSFLELLSQRMVLKVFDRFGCRWQIPF